MMDKTGVIPVFGHVFSKLRDNQWDLEDKVQVHIFQSRLDMWVGFYWLFSCDVKFVNILTV